MPGASAEEAAYFNDFQKACGPAENIARFREVFDEMDVSKLLPKVDGSNTGRSQRERFGRPAFRGQIPGRQHTRRAFRHAEEQKPHAL